MGQQILAPILRMILRWKRRVLEVVMTTHLVVLMMHSGDHRPKHRLREALLCPRPGQVLFQMMLANLRVSTLIALSPWMTYMVVYRTVVLTSILSRLDWEKVRTH